jgi:hypothetical protein
MAMEYVGIWILVPWTLSTIAMATEFVMDKISARVGMMVLIVTSTGPRTSATPVLSIPIMMWMAILFVEM